MKPAVKVAIVAGGYLAALAAAIAITAVYIWLVDSPERDASGGMSAFGDSVLFLAVFGLASVPASCAMLYFLRSVPLFWHVASIGALLIAATALAMAGAFAVGRASDAHPLYAWATFAPIRILAAPLFVPAFVVAALFAPTRTSRIALVLATAIEGVAFAVFFLVLLEVVRLQ